MLALLVTQAPALLVPATVAHLAPEDFPLAVAALNLLTLLTAFDLGAGVLVSSRRALPHPNDTAALPAAAAMTVAPALVVALALAMVPALRDIAGLDRSLWLVGLVAVAAACRSWLYLMVLAAGTLGRPRAQLAGGIAFTVVALGATAGAIGLGAEPAAASVGAMTGASAVGVAAVLADRPARGLVGLSLGQLGSAARLVRSMAGFSAARSLVQGSAAGFTFVERAIAIARLRPSGLIAYDLAARVLVLPRQVAAASGPALVQEFAATDGGVRRSRALTRSAMLAFAGALPVVWILVIVLAPGAQRWEALQVAIVLSGGQALLVSTVPTTARLNARRQVLPEACTHLGALGLLGIALAAVRPDSPLRFALLVAGVAVLAYGALTVWGAREADR